MWQLLLNYKKYMRKWVCKQGKPKENGAKTAGKTAE